MSFLSEEQLCSIGFKSLGKNVLLSDKATMYGAGRIEVGDNVRIDDFVILSAGKGGITIGRNVHIACFVSLIGAERITLEDFAGISGRSAIYSSTDDFSGDCLTGPTVPERYKNVDSRPVTIGKHVVVGAGCIVLPGVQIGQCSAIGALSLVTKSCDAFGIYAGTPARFVKARSGKLLDLEGEFMSEDC